MARLSVWIVPIALALLLATGATAHRAATESAHARGYLTLDGQTGAALPTKDGVSLVDVVASSETPDVTVLIPQATKMVRAKPGFSKAVLAEADGTPLSGKVTSADGIKKWRFVYNNQLTPDHRFKSAALYYEEGKFTRFVRHDLPFVGTKDIPAVPKMTVATARRKLRAAGHTEAFSAVTLRYPLHGYNESIYTFVFSPGQDWTVGTKSGKVRPL